MFPSRIRRLISFSIDLIFWFVCTILVYILAYIFGADRILGDGFIFKISLNVSYWVYFFGFEFIFQCTVGKWATGMKVIGRYSGKPDAWTIFRRNLIRLIPVEYLSFLYSRVGHHDLFSGTEVVMKNRNQIVQ